MGCGSVSLVPKSQRRLLCLASSFELASLYVHAMVLRCKQQRLASFDEMIRRQRSHVAKFLEQRKVVISSGDWIVGLRQHARIIAEPVVGGNMSDQTQTGVSLERTWTPACTLTR